jgi:hypothetical protein
VRKVKERVQRALEDLLIISSSLDDEELQDMLFEISMLIRELYKGEL